MCCCSNQSNDRGVASARSEHSGTVVLRVDDMTCGHCARAIEAAVRDALPEADATADADAKTVTVRGTGDVAAIRKAVAAAGYTPSTFA